MSIYFDVVCTSAATIDERNSQSVKALGELLPYVLAKYGVAAQSSVAGSAASQDASSECIASQGSSSRHSPAGSSCERLSDTTRSRMAPRSFSAEIGARFRTA